MTGGNTNDYTTAELACIPTLLNGLEGHLPWGSSAADEAPFGLSLPRSKCGLVAMTLASHAEGRQLDPGQVYIANTHVR